MRPVDREDSCRVIRAEHIASRLGKLHEGLEVPGLNEFAGIRSLGEVQVPTQVFPGHGVVALIDAQATHCLGDAPGLPVNALREEHGRVGDAGLAIFAGVPAGCDISR